MKPKALNQAIVPAGLVHPYPFDPSYGYTLAELLSIKPPAAPGDFDAFWRSRYEETRKVAVDPIRLRELEGSKTTAVWEINYRSLGGIRIGGWLTLPRGQKPTKGIVVGHGYGGRGEPELDFPAADAALLFPCARGMSRSRLDGVPESSERHVLHGIDHRDTYIHGGCVADLWCGVSALQQLVPECAERLGYAGGSFGGGIGAMALPWDSRIRRAHLGVPSFGNHPIRLQLSCVGSGEAVRRYAQQHPPIVDRVLPYFDSAIAAIRIRTPTLVAAALFDPAVPPPGQFSVFNALPAQPNQLFILTAGHFEYAAAAEQDRQLRIACRRFFEAL